jgi:flagellar hook assembly protein FlgD
VNPHAYKVIGKIVQFKTTSVTIVGIGFFGQPKITSSAKGTRAVVSHDSGSVLKVKVTLPKGQSVGVHTFTIALANGKSCKINYTVVA